VPAYLVPDRFVAVDRLPLSANGKVDRAALARRAAETRGAPTSGAPPATDTERAVAAAVGQVLGLAGPAGDVEANFFDLGGDSVSAVRLLSLLNVRLALAIPLDALFGAATIRALSTRIDGLDPRPPTRAETRSGPALDTDDIRARRQKLAARRQER
ncbi:MAG: phosphopantetheine-binding protein, partial [Myxococcota bacterium]